MGDDTISIGNKKYRIDDVIFVIDSTTTVFMVSLISKGKAINCIIEKKIDVDTDNSYHLLKNFVNACLALRSVKEVNVRSRYFIEGGIITRLLKINKFRTIVKNQFKEEKNKIYIGPCTSSIMNCLRCNHENILYLYHGTIDCYRYYQKIRMKDKNTSVKIKHCLKKVIFSQLLKLPNSIWNDFFSLQGFSLVNMNLPHMIWLNYKEFESEKIESLLVPLIEEAENFNSIMFCPISDFHNKNGINSNTTLFNEKNIDLIKKYTRENEKIFLKFHPSIYQLNDNVIVNLGTEINKRFGNIVRDVVQYIPEDIGGALLPLEVLFRYCKFNKIICVETTTIWTLQFDNEIAKIADFSSVTGNRKKVINNFITMMKELSILNDTYLINDN